MFRKILFTMWSKISIQKSWQLTLTASVVCSIMVNFNGFRCERRPWYVSLTRARRKFLRDNAKPLFRTTKLKQMMVLTVNCRSTWRICIILGTQITQNWSLFPAAKTRRQHQWKLTLLCAIIVAQPFGSAVLSDASIMVFALKNYASIDSVSDLNKFPIGLRVFLKVVFKNNCIEMLISNAYCNYFLN